MLTRTGATETHIHCWWECKIVQPQPHWKTICTSYNATILTYKPAIMLPGIYTNDLKTRLHKTLQANTYGSFIRNCPKLDVQKDSLQFMNG
jgi:hypothetical protein